MAGAGKGFGERGAASFPAQHVATPAELYPCRLRTSPLLPHRLTTHLKPGRVILYSAVEAPLRGGRRWN